MPNQKHEDSNFVHELSPDEARDYFLSSKCYSNLELPNYFDFSKILLHCFKLVSTTTWSDNLNAAETVGENYHTVLKQKNSTYSWRRVQLINPLSYSKLVSDITKAENWKVLQKRIRKFQNNQHVICTSFLRMSKSDLDPRSRAIRKWWSNFESETIRIAPLFAYFGTTDLVDCYGSIYTHSIPWAIHGKKTSKRAKNKEHLVGNVIDKNIAGMQWGETSGIPQGSNLMDFVAELVLGYLDELISERIKLQPKIKNIRILRYRDDFRVLAQTSHDVEAVMQIIASCSSELGFALNESKTKFGSDIIGLCVKPDKQAQKKLLKQRSLYESLIQIYALGKDFPTSSRIQIALNKVNTQLDKKQLNQSKLPKESFALALEIGCQNPSAFPAAIGIISRILNELDNADRNELLFTLVSRVERMPQNGFYEVWLQRITVPYHFPTNFEELLCQKVSFPKAKVWNSEWLSGINYKKAQLVDFIDREVVNEISSVIPVAEISTRLHDS